MKINQNLFVSKAALLLDFVYSTGNRFSSFNRPLRTSFGKKTFGRFPRVLRRLSFWGCSKKLEDVEIMIDDPNCVPLFYLKPGRDSVDGSI